MIRPLTVITAALLGAACSSAGRLSQPRLSTIFAAKWSFWAFRERRKNDSHGNQSGASLSSVPWVRRKAR